MAILEARQLKKHFGSIHAVDGIDFRSEDGELLAILGPSGSGKSTLMRMVAGLEEPTAGDITVNGESIVGIPPRRRNVAMVFQSFALYPHITVRENIRFPLAARKVPETEQKRKIDWVAEILDIRDLLDRRPSRLSGGQSQRVALARAMVRDPDLFVFDEPLSSLDAQIRSQARGELRSLLDRTQITTLYVTHDQVEAMTMGDRVAVLKLGVLQQAGKPQELFSNPANLFVASFIGSPAMNLLEAEVVQQDGGLAVRFGSLELGVGDDTADKYPGLKEYVGKHVVLGLRPDYFFRPDASVPPPQRLVTRVSLVEPLGTEVLAHLDTDATKVLTEATDPTGEGEEADDADREALKRNAKLTTKFPTQDAPEAGAQFEVAYDIERMYFFDLDSGLAL